MGIFYIPITKINFPQPTYIQKKLPAHHGQPFHHAPYAHGYSIEYHNY